MLNWILELQKKPLHVKSQTAFVAAAIGTGIVALIWATTLPARFASFAPDVVPEDTNNPLLDDALSPYAEYSAQDTIEEPVETQPMTEDAIRTRVDTLIDTVKQKDSHNTTPASAKVENNTTTDSNVGKPVIVEPSGE